MYNDVEAWNMAQFFMSTIDQMYTEIDQFDVPGHDTNIMMLAFMNSSGQSKIYDKINSRQLLSIWRPLMTFRLEVFCMRYVVYVILSFINVIPKCHIEIAFDYANDVVYINPLHNTQVFFFNRSNGTKIEHP